MFGTSIPHPPCSSLKRKRCCCVAWWKASYKDDCRKMSVAISTAETNRSRLPRKTRTQNTAGAYCLRVSKRNHLKTTSRIFSRGYSSVATVPWLPALKLSVAPMVLMHAQREEQRVGLVQGHLQIVKCPAIVFYADDYFSARNSTKTSMCQATVCLVMLVTNFRIMRIRCWRCS